MRAAKKPMYRTGGPLGPGDDVPVEGVSMLQPLRWLVILNLKTMTKKNLRQPWGRRRHGSS